MDAPNAPNPANPNVQDQNADAVQGPANHAQGPAVQNPAQVPTNQNQAQVPAGQIPATSSSSSGTSSRSHTGWSNYTCPTTTRTGPHTTGPCWYCSARSKLDREETRILS